MTRVSINSESLKVQSFITSAAADQTGRIEDIPLEREEASEPDWMCGPDFKF